MATPESTRTTDASLASDLLHAARYYLGNRTVLVVLAIIAIGAGIALKWEWLVAAGIAPILLTALPCLIMCGFGLCMNKLVGGPGAKEQQLEASTQAGLTAPEPGQMWVRSQSGDVSPGANASSKSNQVQPHDERSKSDA